MRADGWIFAKTAGICIGRRDKEASTAISAISAIPAGGKWQGDIFAAAFSEKVQGETADYDLSLSANYDGRNLESIARICD